MSSLPTYRLPDSWTTPEIVEDVIVADDLELHRAGLATLASDGEEVCGSAADARGSALSRGWFELLERVSGLEALRNRRESYLIMSAQGEPMETWGSADVFPESDEPDRWRYSRSNGIALHVDWATACERARWELVERDRLLRAWYGETAPVRCHFELASTPLAMTKSYEWRAYSFPESTGDHRADSDHEAASTCTVPLNVVDVVGVFGFPTRSDLPFVLGAACRPRTADALMAASTEALQMLAFLWGEPLPEAPPDDRAPVGPMQHLDTYQVKGAHQIVKRWLEGGHLAYGFRKNKSEPTKTVGFGYVDLTPPWLPNDLRVAKAVSRETSPLIFGASPFTMHLPPELRLHPIP